MQQQLSQSEIIYDEQSIQKIQELNINILSDYSKKFRVSYQEIQSESSKKNIQSDDTQLFHQGVVTLICKIQPSKIAVTAISSDIASIKTTYFPEDNKYRLRNQAKEKRILIINKLTTEEELELINDIEVQIQKFKKFILLRESQLGAVLFLQDYRQQYSFEELKQRYQESYKEIIQFVVPPSRCNEPINFRIIQKIFKYEFVLFEQLSSKSKRLQDELNVFEDKFLASKFISNEQQIGISKILRQLKILTSKLATLVELFPYACLKPKDDLFSQQLTSKRWRDLFENDIIYYKLYGQPLKIDKSFNQLRTNLNIINATMNIFNQAKINPKGLQYWNAQFESIKKVLKCTVSTKTAHHQAELMISQPSEELAKQIWNLPQKKEFKAFIELTLPSISFSQHIYIPRKVRQYFFERLKGNKVNLPYYKIDNLKAYYEDLQNQLPHAQRLSIRINNSFQLDLKAFQEDRQQNFIKKQFTLFKNNIQSIKNAFKKTYQAPKTIIFHIHGGGFISMSSFIHQTYTRKWSNSLNVPIISVDYGKAPQYPFPQGLYDCLQAYLWTINSFNQIYNVNPQKIILVGDSAGGNLVAALTNLLIEWKLRVPDGIVLAYPALNLNYYDFTPSLLTALNDMILPHTFLKICLKSYLKDPIYQPDKNYFISPMRAPPAILKQYPPTRIFVGSKDPFHDDCCRFTQQLSKFIQKKVQMVVFEEFPHGFLQFDMKNSPHYYCQQATKEVENALRQLINQ